MTYLPALSGLRAFACIAVVLFHAKVPWGSGGYLGVDMFFVLSGYLMVSILSRYDRPLGVIDVASFMESRIRRIVPLLVTVCLAVGVGMVLTSDPSDGSVGREMISSMAMFSNFTLTAGYGPDFLGHSWSLAAEMQFYFLVSLIFMATTPASRGILLPVFALVFLAVTGLRFMAFYQGMSWSSIYFSPVLRVSGLFLGAAIALLPAGVGRLVAPLGWPAALVAGFAVVNAVHLSAISFTIWSTTTEIATGVLILAMVAQPESGLSKVLSGKHIERLGLWSFGIYLWHYPITRLLRDVTTPEAAAAITLLISVPLAAVSYRFVEQRYRRSNASGVSLKAVSS